MRAGDETDVHTLEHREHGIHAFSRHLERALGSFATIVDCAENWRRGKLQRLRGGTQPAPRTSKSFLGCALHPNPQGVHQMVYLGP